MSHTILDQQDALRRQHTQRALARVVLRFERQLKFLEKRGDAAKAAYAVIKAERDEADYLLRTL